MQKIKNDLNVMLLVIMRLVDSLSSPVTFMVCFKSCELFHHYADP